MRGATRPETYYCTDISCSFWLTCWYVARPTCRHQSTLAPDTAADLAQSSLSPPRSVFYRRAHVRSGMDMMDDPSAIGQRTDGLMFQR